MGTVQVSFVLCKSATTPFPTVVTQIFTPLIQWEYVSKKWFHFLARVAKALEVLFFPDVFVSSSSCFPKIYLFSTFHITVGPLCPVYLKHTWLIKLLNFHFYEICFILSQSIHFKKITSPRPTKWLCDYFLM